MYESLPAAIILIMVIVVCMRERQIRFKNREYRLEKAKLEDSIVDNTRKHESKYNDLKNTVANLTGSIKNHNSLLELTAESVISQVKELNVLILEERIKARRAKLLLVREHLILTVTDISPTSKLLGHMYLDRDAVDNITKNLELDFEVSYVC